ncbi:H+/Cl- antiporter ClcA [Rhizobium beringeri]
MPFLETITHSLLQMVTVALGSPLGGEVAPREWGALTAQRIAELAKQSPDDARVLIACGAGGGLAAVYDVPAAGAVFVMEVLL